MLEWYWATHRKATFGFEVKDGRVVACAPYGSKWLKGRTLEEAVKALERYGFTVHKGSP